MTFSGPLQHLHSLRAERGKGWVELKGDLPAGGDDVQRFRVELGAADPDGAGLLHSLVPGRWRDLADGLGVRGATELSATIRPRSQPAAGMEIQAHCTAEHMKFQVLPLELSRASADFTVHRSGVEIRKLTATYGDRCPVELTGSTAWTDDDGSAELRVAGSGIELTPEPVFV